VASACGAVFGGSEELTVTAAFDDVNDLVTRAGVRAGDVPIGTVTDIELTDDNRALVTMSIEPDTGLPREVQAALAKTSLLGERFIDLRPTGDSGSLEDGQHIADTTVVQDFEDFVAAGNEALALVAADQLAAAVQTGAQAFGGRGGLVGQFITEVETLVGRYDEGSEDLVRLIDSLDQLTAELAPDARTNADALATLREASDALGRQDDRLLDALEDLTRLSVVGGRILDEHEREFDNAVRRLRVVAAQVNRFPDALQNLLTFAPRHNLHVPNGVVNEEGQVWLDFIVCGLNETDGDPSRDCTPPNPGQPSSPPPHQVHPESCDEAHVNCDGDGDDGDGGAGGRDVR
jgi:phospholipid/cholesterol/gamma-HCH transport system substrate-binding protein